MPGRHNSGWLESPGWKQVDDFASGDDKLGKRLKHYVQTVLGRFAEDPRVLGWDLYNEPGGVGKKPDGWQQAHGDASAPLLEAAFDWAWQINPSQPLTSGYYRGDFKKIVKLQLERSDVISFHHYGPAEELRKMIIRLEKASPRPVSMCTEYMARPAGSTFDA